MGELSPPGACAPARVLATAAATQNAIAMQTMVRRIVRRVLRTRTWEIFCDACCIAACCRPFSADVEDPQMSPLALCVRVERWPIAGSFTISRGAKTEAVVVVAELSDGTHRGRGECVPYARYGETVAGVAAAIEAMGPEISSGLDRERLQSAMAPGAARNALDCAFWDLAAKRAGRPIHELLGMSAPKAVTTAYTISLATPEAMAKAAAGAAERALPKIKLGAQGDPARIAAVRRAAPRAELIVDANEGWTESDLATNLAACAEAAVTLIEQPLPAEHDDALARIVHPLPICADESAHASASVSALVGKYDAVNIKLDKAGGLTEAL